MAAQDAPPVLSPGLPEIYSSFPLQPDPSSGPLTLGRRLGWRQLSPGVVAFLISWYQSVSKMFTDWSSPSSSRRSQEVDERGSIAFQREAQSQGRRSGQRRLQICVLEG